jgi:transcriptional regulator with XRE-family HTH domain
MVHVGNRLKELRIRRAMTQNELAEAAGIDKNTVNRIERNHTEPRPPTLRKLADALRVDPAELIGGG